MKIEDIRADILARKAKAERYVETNKKPGREEQLSYWRGQVDVLDSILRETIPL
jgi:hypothetical protein